MGGRLLTMMQQSHSLVDLVAEHAHTITPEDRQRIKSLLARSESGARTNGHSMALEHSPSPYRGRAPAPSHVVTPSPYPQRSPLTQPLTSGGDVRRLSTPRSARAGVPSVAGRAARNEGRAFDTPSRGHSEPRRTAKHFRYTPSQVPMSAVAQRQRSSLRVRYMVVVREGAPADLWYSGREGATSAM